MSKLNMAATTIIAIIICGMSSAWAEEKTHGLNDKALKEALTSPLEGEFSAGSFSPMETMNQDFGPMSGNTNGMDGYPDASGAPSSYPPAQGGTSPSTTPGY